MTTDEDDERPQAPSARPRRRVRVQAIAFVGVLCAGVLIGWVVFRDHRGSSATGGTSALLDQRTRLDVNRRSFPHLGVTLSVPKGWQTKQREGVLNAASGDDRVSVAISPAGGPGDAKKVRASDRVELARLFHAREVNRRQGKVGTERTIITEFVGRTRKRQRIRILSMGAASRWRTYSVQVFTALAPTATRVVELSTLIASVRFSDPR